MIHGKLEETLTTIVKIEATLEHQSEIGTFQNTRQIQDMCRRALEDFTNPNESLTL